MVDGTYPRPKQRQQTIMSEYGNINVELRTTRGKGVARQLRRKGLVPAVLYGGGRANVSLTLDPHLFRKATDPARNYNTVFSITVEIDGKPATQSCMVADIQRNAVRDDIMHIDFMRVDMDKVVTRKIPVRYAGRAAGVVKGGKLKTFRRMVLVSAKPAELPVELVVDLTALDVGQYLRISDVSLPNTTFEERDNAPLAFVDMPKAKVEETDDAAEEAKA